MRVLLVLLLCIAISTYAYTPLEKLSHDDAIKALRMIDSIKSTTDPSETTNLIKKLEDHVGEKYNDDMKERLYDILNKNANKKSYASKIMGLFSFQNVILVCLVVVVVALIFSLLRDILFILGAFFMDWFYIFFLSRTSLHIQGIAFSMATLCIKYDHIQNPYLKYLFIFDRMTPLFGCIIFYIVIASIYNDTIPVERRRGRRSAYRDDESDKNNDSLVDLVAVVVCVIAAIYHNNWMVAVLAVLLLFQAFGFKMWSMSYGYTVGFSDKNSISKNALVGICLNTFMLLAESGLMTGEITKYIKVFDTAVYMWATFVSSIALLILVDEGYMYYTKTYTFAHYVLRQLLMALYCIALMYFGNVFAITSYKAIGGTFLVLWLLDAERTFLCKFVKGNTTMFLVIIAANLYVVSRLISWYPEYCIF